MASAHHPWLLTEPSKIQPLKNMPCVQQHVSFETLPGEIRNSIYEICLPSEADGDQLIIALPLWNDLITIGQQPAITRANHQIRVAMFYASNTFYAWIDRFNFAPLIRWVKCITSGPSPPTVKVEVRLIHKMRCYVELEKLASARRTLRHETVLLRNKTAYSYVPPMGDKRQCVAVAEAIKTAERCTAGWMGVNSMSREVRSVWRSSCDMRCKAPDYLEFNPSELCSVEAASGY